MIVSHTAPLDTSRNAEDRNTRAFDASGYRRADPDTKGRLPMGYDEAKVILGSDLRRWSYAAMQPHAHSRGCDRAEVAHSLR